MGDSLDTKYMKRAFALARRGRGKTAPNPMVGAVIVKRGVIVGEGIHRGAGLLHAEALALAQAGRLAKGGTLYTNLEPCCHTEKRTGPCTDAIIQSGIQKVVAAMTDPNPLVCGKGFALLQQAGIEVVSGLLHREAERLNEVFIKYITTRKPFVIVKAAMTLDGRIATAKGESRWISGDAARKEVHRLRSEVDAVLVGVGTVLADDPMLITHREGVENPVRVVIDPSLRTPPHAKIVTSLALAPTVLCVTSKASSSRIEWFTKQGVRVEVFPCRFGEIPFNMILKKLGSEGITSVLVEGGGRVNGMLFRSGEADKVIFYIAPTLLCGDEAKSVIAGRTIQSLAEAVALDDLLVRKVGKDLRIEGYVRKER